MHWLIRAQLAERERRTQVADADFHRCDTRIHSSLTRNRHRGRRKGSFKSRHAMKPKVSPTPELHNDGGVPRRSSDTDPSAGEVPDDFDDIGFTALGNPMGNLVVNTDEWSHVDVPDATAPWRDRPILTERPSTLESWWGQSPPQLHASAEM